MENFNIVMLGAPGSGKGTQAKIIAEKFQFAHISTGELFRKEIASGNALGQEAKSYIERGALCPDTLTINMLHDYLSSINHVNGHIFDGVPRTTRQAEMLDGINYPTILPLHLVINLTIDPDEILKRLLKRAEIEGRSDDTPEIIQQRITHYFEQTKPLEEYYEAKGILRNINGMNAIEKVFEDICQVVVTEINNRNNL